MFNLFRNKNKIRVIKSRRLIDLRKVEGLKNSYNIVINEAILNDFHSRVQTILNELHIYDDKMYVEAYKEYQDHYKVYDIVPDLLLYKIPELFATCYPKIEDISKDFVFRFFILDELYYENLPKEFKLEELLEDTLKELYSRVYPYLTHDKLSVKEYIELIRCNYCKNWDKLWYNSSPSLLKNYFYQCTDAIMEYTDEDCLTVVTNILKRCAEELNEKLQLTHKNEGYE